MDTGTIHRSVARLSEDGDGVTEPEAHTLLWRQRSIVSHTLASNGYPNDS